MELIKDRWVNNDYHEFLSYLISLGEEKMRAFNMKLIPDDKKKFIGIKAPILREIAKEISKGDLMTFLDLVSFEYLEETILYGLVLAKAKLSFDNLTTRLNYFIPFISNWAEVDMTASYKQFAKEQERGMSYIKSLIDTNSPWHIRYALILLLSHYLNPIYINEVLDISRKVNNTHYYVEMANAWLISTAFVKFPEETEKLLQSFTLNKFTQNKAIQKIRESLRVSTEDKSRLLEYKLK